jgi:hypothetical protein
MYSPRAISIVGTWPWSIASRVEIRRGSLVAVMAEYWLADQFGRLWLNLHKSLRPSLGELPNECSCVARGQRLSAGRLYRVQSFAARVWWRAGMAAVLLTLPVIGLTAAVRPGRVGMDVAVSLVGGLGCLGGVAILQMGLLSFRSGQIELYLRKGDATAWDEPMPSGSLGLSTRWDFWVTLLIGMAVFGVLLFAGTRSAHGR